MRVLNLRTAAIALVAGLGLGGCAYGPYGGLGVGVGYGDPYYNNGYGYSPYGYGAGYSPYGYGSYGSYSPYGYGYGSPYWGWNDGFYYPGTGYYVYDQYRNPYRWTDTQRRYWEGRRQAYNRGDSGTNRILQNWADFQNGPQANTTNAVRQQQIEASRSLRNERLSREQIEANRALRDQRVTQQQFGDQARFERQQVRDQARIERQQMRTVDQENRQSARAQVRSERSGGGHHGLRVRNSGADNE